MQLPMLFCLLVNFSWFGLVLSYLCSVQCLIALNWFLPYRNGSCIVLFMERDAEMRSDHEEPQPDFVCVSPFASSPPLNVAPTPSSPFLLSTTKTMASIQVTASSKTESAKTTDIGRDVVHPAQGKLNYLTSDQGVKISDTDNW